jgi:membrane protease YdiL (CAAX protease family)
VNLRAVPWRLIGRLVASLIVALAAIYLQDEAIWVEPDLSPWYFRAGAAVVGALELAFLLAHAEVRRWIRAVSIDQWRAIDAEPGAAGKTSLTVLAVLVTCCAALTVQEYVGGSDVYTRLFPYDGGRYWELEGFAWWSAWRVIGYVLIPIGVIALLPGERIRDYHVSFHGFLRHFWIYLALYVAFLPVVYLASRTESFRHTYPFYRMANRSHFDLWAWQVLYAVQFVSLEFFFRGFLLQGLRRALGANAIFVMIVPYCMIHYGKPLTETIGAIGAGLILGTLAMRTRSIWGGVVIHIGVATTMDVLALAGCPPMGSKVPCHD